MLAPALSARVDERRHNHAYGYCLVVDEKRRILPLAERGRNNVIELSTGYFDGEYPFDSTCWGDEGLVNGPRVTAGLRPLHGERRRNITQSLRLSDVCLASLTWPDRMSTEKGSRG